MNKSPVQFMFNDDEGTSAEGSKFDWSQEAKGTQI